MAKFQCEISDRTQLNAVGKSYAVMLDVEDNFDSMGVTLSASDARELSRLLERLADKIEGKSDG